MKAIRLSCKTAGFLFGDTVVVGDDENQISSKIAKGLVEDKLAIEVKDTIVSSGNQDLIDEIELLQDEIQNLEEQLEEAISLPKGQKPDGYKKA